MLSHFPILKLIYPVRESSRTRTRDLKISLHSLGRTYTDSRRNTLAEPGYCGIHHSLRYVSPSATGE